MPRHPHHRPSSQDTRQLLAQLIEARQVYAEYLHGVANGKQQPDSAKKSDLKQRCDETFSAWRAAHEAWQLDAFPSLLDTTRGSVH